MAPKRKLRSSEENEAGEGSGAGAFAGGAAGAKAGGAQQRAAKKSKPKKVNTVSLPDRVEISFLPNGFKPDLTKLVEGAPGTRTGRPLRLYADGIFDLFHYGHARALEQAKRSFPNSYLLVGCCNDKLTHELKGRTVLKDTERYESLKHCKWVDEVVADAPWVVDDAFIAAHQASWLLTIDFVCHDALPYGDASGQSSSGDVYAHLKRQGRFVETQRTDGISTSDIITSIIQDYDVFVRRNMERGYNARDMNVPFLKEQAIKFDIVKDKVTRRVGKVIKDRQDKLTQQQAGRALTTKGAKSRGGSSGRNSNGHKERHNLVLDLGNHAQETITDMQRNFVQIFDRDGAIRTSFREQRRQIRERVNVLARSSFC
ncbi:unnamed protein product [Pylaiella littoralis]